MDILRLCKHIGLRLARPADAAFILSLRLDDSRNQYLSRVADDLQAQQRWLAQYVEREQAGTERYYVILDKDDRDIGMVRVYDYRGDSFSWGSWILCPDAPNYAAIETAVSIYELGFGQLGFKRSHFEVMHGNQRVIDFHLFFGARKTTRDDAQQQFELTLADYLAGRKRYRRFLVGSGDEAWTQTVMPPSTPMT